MHQGWSNGPGGTLYVCRLDPWGHLVKINLAIWGRIRRSLTTVICIIRVVLRTFVPHLFSGHFPREGHDLAGGLIPASLLDEPGVSLKDQVGVGLVLVLQRPRSRVSHDCCKDSLSHSYKFYSVHHQSFGLSATKGCSVKGCLSVETKALLSGAGGHFLMILKKTFCFVL